MFKNLFTHFLLVDGTKVTGSHLECLFSTCFVFRKNFSPVFFFLKKIVSISSPRRQLGIFVFNPPKNLEKTKATGSQNVCESGLSSESRGMVDDRQLHEAARFKKPPKNDRTPSLTKLYLGGNPKIGGKTPKMDGL